MRAIVIKNYGGPEQLAIEPLPVPEPAPGQVVVKVYAFGLNHAEAFMRQGAWGDVAKVTGIECVGEVHADPSGGLRKGQRVFALMGGMGRTINGSYAEYVRVPAANVVPIESQLDWVELAALPESYATAWTFVRHMLDLVAGQILVVRGGTSALGQAAINIAKANGCKVFATSRSREKFPLLAALGAEPLVDASELSAEVRRHSPGGVDGVLDIIGNRTLLDSLKMARPGGRVSMAGFLGGFAPVASFDPLAHLPSGVQLSFFASAFVFGTPDFPLAKIPLQEIVDLATKGSYHAKPAHVFHFDEIVEAHRLMESGGTRGKIVVQVGRP